MRSAGLDGGHALENNVAVWKLVDFLNGNANSPPESTADDGPAQVSQGAVEEKLAPLEPTNLVLYGPPGTGKTFQVIEEAIALLAPEMLEGQPHRTSIKAKFDELVAAGQIVFTTFHQNFSYEDFVEGLRAETDAEGRLRYRVLGGVFKRLCGYEDAEPAERSSLPSAKPKAIEPGRYTVVLEAAATANLLWYLATALDRRSVDEGRSAFVGKVGSRVVNERFTLRSDPRSTPIFPFDAEDHRSRPARGLTRACSRS